MESGLISEICVQQKSAYGMHAGALQGHIYVYPAYPATIVPQQHINPALQGMLCNLYL